MCFLNVLFKKKDKYILKYVFAYIITVPLTKRSESIYWLLHVYKYLLRQSNRKLYGTGCRKRIKGIFKKKK